MIRQARVPSYLHHFGPKKFTSIQHVKCRLLKEIPGVSTLKKFVKRLPFWLKSMLVAYSSNIESADYGAIDSTGLSRTNASQHYAKRIDRKNPIKKSLKLSLYTTRNHILSFRLRSEWCGDTKDVAYLLNQSPIIALVNCMDKGYDANYIHQYFRELETYSIIPARKGCRRGNYRKEMRDFFDYAQYWERNCAEWNNSSLKRVFGDYVKSHNFRTQHSEVAARIILHNLKVILVRLFHVSHK